MNFEDAELETNKQSNCLTLTCPKIYNGKWRGESLSNFDTITIVLDGRLNSLLEWEAEKQYAKEIVKAGYNIFWRLDLGLENQLPFPFDHQAQFLSLSLAIQHFNEYFWPEFKGNSIGLSFYQGSADFISLFHWDDTQFEAFNQWLKNRQPDYLQGQSLDQLLNDPEGYSHLILYCRDVVIEYFNLFIHQFNPEISLFLLLDFKPLAGLLYREIAFLNSESLHSFALVLKNTVFLDSYMGWNIFSSKGYIGHSKVECLEKEVRIGVSLPPTQYHLEKEYHEIIAGISQLIDNGIPFKLILEDQLTAQWDGLDYLMISSSVLSVQGKRKALGFCAAGGEIIKLGDVIHFPNEICLEKLIRFY